MYQQGIGPVVHLAAALNAAIRLVAFVMCEDVSVAVAFPIGFQSPK